MGSESSSTSKCHYYNGIQDKFILGQKIIEGYEARREVLIWFDHTDLIFKTDKDIYFKFGFHCKETNEDYQCSFNYYTEKNWELELVQYKGSLKKIWEMNNENFVITFIDIEKIFKDVADTETYCLTKNNCNHLAEKVKKKIDKEIEDLQK